MGDRLGDGRAIAGTKVVLRCAVVLFTVRVTRVPAAHFGMGVNVNGEEVLVVHGELKAVDLQEGCYPYTLLVDWGNCGGTASVVRPSVVPRVFTAGKFSEAKSSAFHALPL